MQLLAQNLDGPPAQPARGGLLTAAQPGGATNWQDGVVVWPDVRGGWRIVQHCTVDTLDHGLDDDEPLPVGARPVVVQARVTTRRSTVAEMSARARRKLDAVTGPALARELWTGEATKPDPFGLPGPQEYANPTQGVGDDRYLNPHLDSGQAEMFTAALPPALAVGEVEARAAELVPGGPVYLHVPLALVTELAPSLVPRGDLLYTAAGSLIVPDPGYPGESPRTIYGTGPVVVWTGPITVFDDPSQVVSTSDNTVEVWAERPALVVFDPQTLVGCPVQEG